MKIENENRDENALERKDSICNGDKERVKTKIIIHTEKDTKKM